MKVIRFDGLPVSAPFGWNNQAETVWEEYEEFLNIHDDEDVLVISGEPTSKETYRNLLDDVVPGAGVPNVTSVVVHATSVVNRTTDRAILSDTLRREIVHRFLEGSDFESSYLERAARQVSFAGDIAGLMEMMVWQGSSGDVTPELVEVGGLVDEVHQNLAELGHLEWGQLVAETAKALANHEPNPGLVDVDAVLAAEFEEFFPVDRRYLSNLSNGPDLVCVAVRDSSVVGRDGDSRVNGRYRRPKSDSIHHRRSV